MLRKWYTWAVLLALAPVPAQAATFTLGVSYKTVTPDQGFGLRILTVTPNSAADAVGLQPGDILIGVDPKTGAPVADLVDGPTLTKNMQLSQGTVHLWWQRNGRNMDLDVHLQVLDSSVGTAIKKRGK